MSKTIDLEQLARMVKGRVPGVRAYPHHSGEAIDLRRDGTHAHQVTVQANGDVLGAWPIRTKTDRRLMRAVLDEIDAQEAEG